MGLVTDLAWKKCSRMKGVLTLELHSQASSIRFFQTKDKFRLIISTMLSFPSSSRLSPHGNVLLVFRISDESCGHCYNRRSSNNRARRGRRYSRHSCCRGSDERCHSRCNARCCCRRRRHSGQALTMYSNPTNQNDNTYTHRRPY
jgi:hypothetical protein